VTHRDRRDADVFDLGDCRMLRRHKAGRPATKQAALLPYAARGDRVPTLYDATGADLILERLDGSCERGSSTPSGTPRPMRGSR
jgi:hypothetical protein